MILCPPLNLKSLSAQGCANKVPVVLIWHRSCHQRTPTVRTHKSKAVTRLSNTRPATKYASYCFRKYSSSEQQPAVYCFSWLEFYPSIIAKKLLVSLTATNWERGGRGWGRKCQVVFKYGAEAPSSAVQARHRLRSPDCCQSCLALGKGIWVFVTDIQTHAWGIIS